MPDIDYDPVETPDDEEERRRQQSEYPPVELTQGTSKLGPAAGPPVPPDIQAAADARPPLGVPQVGPKTDLSPIADTSAYPAAAPKEAVQPQRPLWKDYAPVQKHGIGRVGQVLGEMFLGTESKADNRAGEAYKNATAEYEAALKDQQETALTNETNARADALRHPVPKDGVSPEEKFMVDALHGNNGGPKMDAEGKPYSYLTAHGAWKQAEQDTKPDTSKSDKVTRVVNGQPHTILIDAKTGKDIQDEGVTKLPGESADAKRAANESAQVEREARVNIRKAEGQYRDTQKSVGQLNSAIDAAKDGNGLLTSFVPTMEVLGINAANGVHRISPAEAHAANLPGGYAEQFNAWFDKAANGKTTPELVTEGKALAKILLKSSYDRYAATHADENGIVEGYGGKGFKERVPLIKAEEEQGGKDLGVAPQGKAEGSTGKMPDGTKVVVKGGRLVSQ